MESNTINSTQPTTIVEPSVNRSSFLVILLSILLIISCLIAGFFAWKTQQLVSKLRVMSNESKPTTIATASPTPDPTADWKTYTDTKLGYSIQYPYELAENNNPIVSQVNLIGNELSISITWSQHAADQGNAGGCLTACSSVSKDGEYNLTLLKQFPKTTNNTGFIIKASATTDNVKNRNDIDQILSTFKFIEPGASSSPLPVACTMDAKICPDGSAVGRSGPKCEFAPCPTPKS